MTLKLIHKKLSKQYIKVKNKMEMLSAEHSEM